MNSFYSLPELYALFLLLALFLLFFRKFGHRLQRVAGFITVIVISIIYGFRDASVGVDTQEYISRYNGGVITNDVLFSYFGSSLQALGVPPDWYLFILSLITSSLFFFALRNFTGNYIRASLFLLLIAVLPYGVMFYINIIRQGIAVALIVYGLSLAYTGMRKYGLTFSIASLFVHKTTSLVYLSSILARKIMRLQGGRVLLVSLFGLMLFMSFALPSIMPLFGEDIASKYKAYSGRDTSEAAYLIYVKIAWASMHLFIITRLNKVRKIFEPLYYYFIWLFVLSITSIGAPLVSSRLLASVDVIIPVLYAQHTIGTQKRGLYSLGIAMLIVYAVVSPFIFNLYSVNFGW